MTATISTARLPVTLSGLTIRYGTMLAVDNLDLAIAPGEILALLGPSGCGKTTTLKAITGLQPVDAGTIRFGDRDVTHVAPHRRNVGMVFQSYALFPHLTVTENIAFGLSMHRVPTAERPGRIQAVLDLLRIGELRDRYPTQLSGGQQQRVALARALVVAPAVLLLDEPLSALDRQLRDDMRRELRRLLKEIGITALIVTHDQDEALTLSDRIAVMRAGRLEQVDAARDVYARPANRFVAGFLGRSCYLTGTVEAVDAGGATVVVAGQRVRAGGYNKAARGQTVTLAVRPETFCFAATPDSASFTARLEGELYAGGVSDWHLRLNDGQAVTVSATDNAPPPKPDADGRVALHLPPGRATVLAD